MSWLYTIVFAGLLMSNYNEPASRIQSDQMPYLLTTRSSDDLVEKVEQSYPLNSNGRVSVSNVNGSITVEAWDKNEVRLEATKIADSQESMALMEVVVDSKPSEFSVKTEYKQWGFGSGAKQRRRAEVQYRLSVPRDAVLDEIETVNGSVSVSNFTNFVKVSAVNGQVDAVNLRGRIKLSTVNGTVKTDFDRIEPGTSIALESVNGRVNLELPSDVNATLKADSLNGGITNDFGLPVIKGKYIGRNLHGRLGTGDVQVKLSTVNGSLSILRKRDGRTPSQVTNLGKAESDDEFLVGSRPDDKENAEAIRSAAKAAESGLKEAQKAIEKINVEIPAIELPPMKELEDMKGLKVKMEERAVRKIAAESLRNQRESVRLLSDAMWRRSPTSLEQRSNSFSVKGQPRVTISAPRCNVSVRGWDQNKVKYVLTESRIGSSQPLVVTEEVGANDVAINVAEPVRSRALAVWGDDNVIRLEVFVPRRSDINVETERDIRLQGVSGTIELRTESSVNVRDSGGKLDLKSSDGLVRIVGFKGILDLETSDCDVFLEGDFERIDSHAADGNITLTLPSNKNASISTNIAIESEGLNIMRESDRTWRLGSGGPKYDFQFSEGSLRVRSSSMIETN